MNENNSIQAKIDEIRRWFFVATKIWIDDEDMSSTITSKVINSYRDLMNYYLEGGSDPKKIACIRTRIIKEILKNCTPVDKKEYWNVFSVNQFTEELRMAEALIGGKEIYPLNDKATHSEKSGKSDLFDARFWIFIDVRLTYYHVMPIYKDLLIELYMKFYECSLDEATTEWTKACEKYDIRFHMLMKYFSNIEKGRDQEKLDAEMHQFVTSYKKSKKEADSND